MSPASTYTHNKEQQEEEEEEDEGEALFKSLEDEDDDSNNNYKTQRIHQLHAEFQHHQHQYQKTTTTSADDTYPTLPNDQSLLTYTTSSHRCIIHFFHADFPRCKTMDAHIRQLASLHYEVKWGRVDVERIPFVVNKLAIRVLPCVVAFRDGVVVERVVGFEGLQLQPKKKKGITTTTAITEDAVSTRLLERRLFLKGVLLRLRFREDGDDDDDEEDDEDEEKMPRTIRSAYIRPDDDDDDWD